MRSAYLYLIIGVIAISCNQPSKEYRVDSPNSSNKIIFNLNDDGQPFYLVKHNNETVIDTSYMSFDFQDQPSLGKNLKVLGSKSNSFDETWKMLWGEQSNVRNHYNELVIELQEKEALMRRLKICFKAYNDGIGFRYEFQAREGVDSVKITDENTEFQLTGDHDVWWIPGDWDIYEHLYTESKVSKINATTQRNHPNLSQTYIPENAVNTPVTMKMQSGVHLSFHEANLTDYAGMTLKVDTTSLRLTSELVGSENTEYKVKRELPFKTPWRMVIIADKASELIDSKLVVNLNEPNRLGDMSWFQPMKYVGIWWEMHLGISTWDHESSQSMNSYMGMDVGGVTHGATTENAKRYIDFAAANEISGLLVEGWNTGWDHWIGFEDREGVFDFVTPYPDYDLKEVVRYGKERGVEIIMHHETSAATGTYDQQKDTAYSLMQSLGIHSVKTGYVGKITPKGEYHHGQYMVNHYRRVLETAAKYQVAIDAHEPIKPTGIRRTLPNAISREGLRGQEFNAWATDGGNPPSHLPTVAFTRMLAGPIDFTPGVFDISLPQKQDNQINTTIAQQLALYVVIYSPIQMACDLPENYEDNPALQFIHDVGVDWKQTVVLHGEVGDFVTVARQERETGNWFVGGITDENSREVEVNFDFLEGNTVFQAVIYKDTEDTHYRTNPTDIEIEEMEITSKSNLTIQLAEGGGFAISLISK